MKKRIANGHFSQVDLALIIHEILELPLDKVKHYPSEGLKIVATIVRLITEALNRGEDVHIPRFGTFKVTWSRNGFYVPKPAIYNPGRFGHKHTTYSDTPVMYPKKKRVTFTPSVHLTAMLNLEHPSAHERNKAITKW